jgi:hypothetical protein
MSCYIVNTRIGYDIMQEGKQNRINVMEDKEDTIEAEECRI